MNCYSLSLVQILLPEMKLYSCAVTPHCFVLQMPTTITTIRLSPVPPMSPSVLQQCFWVVKQHRWGTEVPNPVTSGTLLQGAGSSPKQENICTQICAAANLHTGGCGASAWWVPGFLKRGAGVPAAVVQAGDLSTAGATLPCQPGSPRSRFMERVFTSNPILKSGGFGKTCVLGFTS